MQEDCFLNFAFVCCKQELQQENADKIGETDQV